MQRGTKGSSTSRTTTGVVLSSTFNGSNPNHNNSNNNSKMQLSPAQQDLLRRLKSNPDTGLTNDQVTELREQLGAFNVVKPPIDCPPTVCCLLPCIKHVPSMKAFSLLTPDDAEVLRDSKWIRYDVSSLVPGDIIRMEEGDVVPADCVVLDLFDTSTTTQELLVDLRAVTGQDKPASAQRIPHKNMEPPVMTYVQPTQLYWGGTVVQGSALAVVTAIGPDCFVATLIAQGKFPPTPNVYRELGQTPEECQDEPTEEGISLVQQAQQQELERTME